MANMTPIFGSISVLAMTAAVTGVLIEDAENVDGLTLCDHNEDIVVEVNRGSHLYSTGLSMTCNEDHISHAHVVCRKLQLVNNTFFHQSFLPAFESGAKFSDCTS